MDYEEIRLLKQSDKSTVLLIRKTEDEQLFIKKILNGQHHVYSELRNCPHPYLPKLYEVEINDSSTTIIEEYVEGPSLGNAGLPEKQLLKAIKELCSVLEFLHAKGIIHRDIKPSNILAAQDGHIRLIDFDAARLTKDGLEQDTRLLGTRGYAPPEQYGFAQTDARADIYALGVTLEQLLGESTQRSRYKRIIKKCSNLNPDNRYQSTLQVRSALSNTKRIALFSSVAILLIVGLWYGIPRRPIEDGETQAADAALTILPAPGNPHWEAETGIAAWDNVPESGSPGGDEVQYTWRVYRKETATPPAADESGWILNAGTTANGGPATDAVFDWNFGRHLSINGFYYFAVSAVGDGVAYANSPFAVSDAFEYTGEDAPPMPAPAELKWVTVESNNGPQYFAAVGNLDAYLDSDSFDVVVYNESGDQIMRNVWTKAQIAEMNSGGIWIDPNQLAQIGGRFRFTAQALTSRPNEFKPSVIPDPVPEEYYSPWLDVSK